MGTMRIDGFTAEIAFDEGLREFEGVIELAPTGDFERGLVCFSGSSVSELEANARELLRDTFALLRS